MLKRVFAFLFTRQIPVAEFLARLRAGRLFRRKHIDSTSDYFETRFFEEPADAAKGWGKPEQVVVSEQLLDTLPAALQREFLSPSDPKKEPSA